MARKAKDFSLADMDGAQAFDLEKKQTEDPQAAIHKLAQQESKPAPLATVPAVDPDQPIRLDIDATDLIKVKQQAKKAKQNPKAKKLDNLKAYKDLHSFLSFNRKVPIREKQTFYDLMAVMVEAGIPILQALKVFSGQCKHKYFKKVCRAMIYQLERGQKFSATLSDYPKIFAESERGIIAAAEATGRLVDAFRRLTKEIEKISALKSKVRGALIYPSTVMVFVVITVFVLLRFVVPQISQLFIESDLQLPLITRIVIGLSQFLIDNGLLVIGGILGFFLINYLLYQSKSVRYYYHLAILKLPIIGQFQEDYAQATFARSLANLVSSGVGIVQTLEISAKSVGNLVYQQKIKLLAKDVTNGISMGDSLANSPYFSPMLINMIAVGEQTAQIDGISTRLANYFTEKVYGNADNFAKLLQPVIIGIVGGIVGVIVLAIMLPMSEILSSVGAL